MKRTKLLPLLLALALLLTLLPISALAADDEAAAARDGDYVVDADTEIAGAVARFYDGSETEPVSLYLPVSIKGDRAKVETADPALLADLQGRTDFVLDFTKAGDLASAEISAAAGSVFYYLTGDNSIFTVWLRENVEGFEQFYGFTQPGDGLPEGSRVSVRWLRSLERQAKYLNAAQRAALEAIPESSADHWKAFDLTATVGDAPASGESLALAVSVDETWDRDQIRSYYMDETGALRPVPNRLGMFKTAEGRDILVAQMPLEHCSVYLVSDVPLMEEVTPCPQDETCPLSAFDDLDPAAWYHDGVHWALEQGLMVGLGGGVFAPDAAMTRAMMVTLLWRFAGEPAAEGAAPFADVPADAWYAPAVAWAAETGCVLGVSDTAFAPGAPVTREQLAALLYRCAQARGDGFVGAWMYLLPCDDRGEVSGWAYEPLCWLTMHGVIGPGEDGLLRPKDAATRAEAADALCRFAALPAEK